MTRQTLAAGPADAPARVVLAHGAGAPMTSSFMEQMAALLAERGIATLRFEFPYMAARRDGGKRKPPPRAETLCADYAALVGEIATSAPPGQRLLIGGKSMGGRVASMVADALHAEGLVAGLVCLGYPFHPPAKPSALRTAHLKQLKCPTLIVQGERDPFGPRDEVEGYGLPASIRFVWAPDGDHDLGPRGASGYTRKGNLALAADAIADFARA